MIRLIQRIVQLPPTRHRAALCGLTNDQLPLLPLLQALIALNLKLTLSTNGSPPLSCLLAGPLNPQSGGGTGSSHVAAAFVNVSASQSLFPGWMAKQEEVEDGRDSCCFNLGPGQFHFCHLWAAPNDSAIV